jgi:hypothetical protein
MGTNTHVPGSGRAGTENRPHESIPFMSTRPKCRAQQPQRGFSRAALERLLKGGHPVEAYCVICDEFWAISARERAGLAAELRRQARGLRGRRRPAAQARRFSRG